MHCAYFEDNQVAAKPMDNCIWCWYGVRLICDSLNLMRSRPGRFSGAGLQPSNPSAEYLTTIRHFVPQLLCSVPKWRVAMHDYGG